MNSDQVVAMIVNDNTEKSIKTTGNNIYCDNYSDEVLSVKNNKKR